MIKKLQIIFLVIIPVLFLFIGLQFNRTHFGNDPEYAYLLNGINIGMLKPVGHTDNPGTTVQIYSAVMLRFAYLVQPDKGEGFQKHILRNSDQYIELERKGLIWINGMVVLVLGVLSWLMLRNIWLSLLLQIMPFTSANLTEHVFTKVSPEPVLFMASAAMVLLCIHFYLLQQKDERKFAVYFALICGFGLATKATFLPLVFIPLLLLADKAMRKHFLVYILPFFFLFTLPAVPQYPHMAKWFMGLTAHTGTYGEGSWGVINPIQYLNDLGAICFSNPVLSVTLLATTLIFVISLINSAFRSEFKNNHIFRMLTAFLVAQAAGVFMVAKHYHANHYLLPELCLMAANWIFIFLYLKEKLLLNFRKALNFMPVLLLMITAGLVFLNRDYLHAANNGYNRSNNDYDKTMYLLDYEYKGYTRTYFYPTSINPYSALRWGNVYSRFNHTPELKELYPAGYFFDVRTHNFSLWETPVAVSTMVDVSGGKLLLVGGPFDESVRKEIEQSGLNLTPVYQGFTQVIYRVEVKKN